MFGIFSRLIHFPQNLFYLKKKKPKFLNVKGFSKHTWQYKNFKRIGQNWIKIKNLNYQRIIKRDHDQIRYSVMLGFFLDWKTSGPFLNIHLIRCRAVRKNHRRREDKVLLIDSPLGLLPLSKPSSEFLVPLLVRTGHMDCLRDRRRKSSIRADYNTSSFAQLRLPFTSHTHCWHPSSPTIITISFLILLPKAMKPH